MRRRAILSLAVLLVLLASAGLARGSGEGGPSLSYRLLQRDVIVGADVWGKRPRMLAAGLGFTGIIGVPGMTTADLAGSESLVRTAGGAWNEVSCAAPTTPELFAYTSASTPQQVEAAYGYPTTYADGLPVEFSWPIRPSTLDASDFRVVLNTGRAVAPELASIFPNAEYNERSVAVLFGHFGNRLPATDPGAEYPVRTEVVADGTPLQLVGLRGKLASAVGLFAEAAGTPYTGPGGAPSERSGPHLVGAKLTRLSTRGESAPLPFRSALPNDGRTLYGKRARFRLRVYTTGGFSPDGVRAVFPTEFERYFRLHVEVGGRERMFTKAGVTYRIAGHRLRVLGLADLGRKQSSYDDCYREDKDNYIDIVLGGERAAVRHITAVEIPASGAYSPFFNPGGPGNDPTPDVHYTAPGPAQTQPVWRALGDPKTVTFRR